MALVNHREVGTDTKSFVKALRSSLREDPDVIMLGEMRDYETISMALTAAETGHLVFATLHASSASKTVDRIIDVFPTGDKEMVRAMLASSLQGVVSQSLLRRTDGGSRIGAYEILVGTNAVRNLIRENQVAQLYSMIQTGSRYGMVTLQDSINALIEQGVVDKEEAMRALLTATDDGGEEEVPQGRLAASLGGTKIETDGKGTGRANKLAAKLGNTGNKDEGYSF
jgi:twitching motility protein PilT